MRDNSPRVKYRTSSLDKLVAGYYSGVHTRLGPCKSENGSTEFEVRDNSPRVKYRTSSLDKLVAGYYSGVHTRLGPCKSENGSSEGAKSFVKLV